MLPRVSLLIIASLLFASAWTSDSQFQDQQAAKRAHVTVQSTHPVRQRWLDRTTDYGFDHGSIARRSHDFRGCFDPSAHVTEGVRSQNIIRTPTNKTESDEIPMDTLWMFGDTDVTLPRDIVAGTYRAVNNRGQVRIIELNEEKLAYHGILAGAPRRDLYVMDDENGRWYFIRQVPTPRMEFARKPKNLDRDRSPSRSVSVASVIEAVMGQLIGTAGARMSETIARAGNWARATWQQLTTEWIALLRQTRSWSELGVDWIHAPSDDASDASRMATGPERSSRN
ncbi:MAG: hypothetical protein AB7O26_03625 [Planctomycetaceae bacterium]